MAAAGDMVSNEGRQQAEQWGLKNVTLLNPDDGPQNSLPGVPTFHVVLAQEAIHDMSHPQSVLQQIRLSLLPDSSSNVQQQQQQQQQQLADALDGYNGGPVFVLTEVRSETSPADNVAGPAGALVYGLSVAVCLGSGLSEIGGAGLGTVGCNEAVARAMCASAGFTRFSKLDWEPSLFNSHYLVRT
jgi:hypothetical protein